MSKLAAFAVGCVVIALILINALKADDVPGDSKIKGHVYYCHDGDTCRVKVSDAIWFNARLAGIDAPEVENSHKHTGSQPWGDAARDKINGLIKDKDVLLRQVDLDPYNRPVVEITIADQNVNLWIIQQGLAEAYRGKTKRLDRQIYEDAEEKAKTEKLGMWAQSNYVSPKSFRDKGR